MRDRGKAVESAHNFDMEYYCSSSEMPCNKHPNSSSIGICAYCLKERLALLVCSDCGEQRLSSCSCSEISSSSNRNSCTGEVGSVGRVSFLIENEKNEALLSKQKPKPQEKEDVVVLRRSSSSCAEIKRSGFWRFGRLFRKKRSEKDCGNKSVGGFDDKSEMWLVDHVGVSRSRSLCSFRGGGLFESEDGGDHLMVSGARSSISAARSSSVTAGMVLDSGRKSGFSEGRKSGFSEGRKSGFSEGRKSGFSEGRKSGFDGEKKDEVLVSELGGNDQFKGVKKSDFSGATKRVFSLKESDFSRLDESGFIDLKLDYSTESKPDLKMGTLTGSESVFGSMRSSDFVAHEYGPGQFGDGIFSHSGSCRITVNERGIKRGRKSLKGGWKWIFRHHPSWGSSTRRKKDEEDMMFKT
ncbi:hypothetical protein RchiOBHm_Chr4g0436671 [Rosa chinensis]|uniref:Uncharacterized protein n=1 Tax=Rosa chinensis TaxID=74649 RepID=A0A2P6R2A0_ROSCH|nr:uncharacterized protein LOC112199963 [Rosa chinensis]PRQ40499.1 hypothetical protein RchiOBHm_Chr4g0436671 [Rosa chinensis]